MWVTTVAEGRITWLRDLVLALAVAVSVFLLSYTNGGFDPTTRAYAAIAAWWLIGAGAALTIATARSQVSRYALAACALLAFYALWILLSMSWAPDGERAFAQFNQVSLYVAALVLAVVLARIVPASVLVGGISLALSGIAAVAFVSRVFPSAFSGSTQSSSILHTLGVRLSFPLGYWNGLGIEVALALPLLLATMVARRSRVMRALAALPVPLIAADMYLTSSRGAFIAAAVAVVAYLFLAPRRWLALGAAVVACGSAALTVELIHAKRALVDGQMTTATGIHQGHVVALVVVLVAIGTAVVWTAIGELGPFLPTPPRSVGWATAGLLVLAAIAATVLSHPIRRFQEFKAQANYHGSSDFVTAHLLSSSGSGRWQFWSAAVSEFRAHPFNGGGAGSYQFWWLQHRPIALYSQFAHSLYLEALGELGIVGFLLLLGAVLVAVVGAVRASLRLGSPEIAGVTACGIAFFVAAGYDWIWQLAGVGIVGVGALGLALGAKPSSRTAPWGRVGYARPLLGLLAVAAIVPQIVVLAAGLHLSNSQAADADGNLARAKSEALAAKAVEPWAASPYLQLGLIDEQQDQYGAAHALLDSAIRRSPDNWILWWYAAQIDVRRGHVLAARRELARARLLDPRDVPKAAS
ncbi:MAG TPA: O-antigen ligase family protein [Gaiellaceae bacterium]|nr:O-antigen ligase family protein [Gaiellaceae bacterium]